MDVLIKSEKLKMKNLGKVEMPLFYLKLFATSKGLK